MDRLELLERRLNRLEKKNRRVKSLLVIACAFAVLPYLVAATQKQKYVNAEMVRADTVQAKEFVFSDEDGSITGFKLTLATQDANRGIGVSYGSDLMGFFSGTSISVYNTKGKAVASLYADKEGGGVEIDRDDGKAAAQLFATANGGKLNIQNSEEMNVIVLDATPDKVGELSLYGPKFHAVMLGADSSGGLIRVLNKSGADAVVLNCIYGGNVGIVNSQGNVAGILGVSPLGAGNFLLYNKDAKKTGQFTTLADDSSGGLQLFKPDGSLIYHAP